MQKEGICVAKERKIDQETQKILNRQIILNCIRKYKEISRIDLAQYTNLSPTTVSVITSELIKSRIVEELRPGESNGGRRPIVLGISRDYNYVITVVLTHKGVKYTLVNLNCQIVEQKQVECDVTSERAVVEVILKCIEDIKGRYSNIMDKVCGIGISVPGVVDHEEGIVLYSSKLRLRNARIAKVITASTGIECFIYKDTDALILGEHNFGVGIGCKNFVYIIVENGVGMSYISSDKLFKPGYGGGFELGHITIDSNGPSCSCGNRGCLGTMVSENAVISRLEKLVEKGFDTGIKNAGSLKLMEVVEYSNNGDRAARYVLEEQARLLGIAAANVVNILNPELIAIGGPFSKCSWGFKELLNEVVKDRSLDIYNKNVKIEFAMMGDDSALLGMANDIYNKKIFMPAEI